MEIIYKDCKVFTNKQIEELFVSVAWDSGNHPEKVVQAMKGYGSVFSAWDNDTLVGLVASFDDGCMVAYTHYLLVNPNYQGYQIGKILMDKVKVYYQDYLYLALIASEGKSGFYEKCGYQQDTKYTAMSLSKF